MSKRLERPPLTDYELRAEAIMREGVMMSWDEKLARTVEELKTRDALVEALKTARQFVQAELDGYGCGADDLYEIDAALKLAQAAA